MYKVFLRIQTDNLETVEYPESRMTAVFLAGVGMGIDFQCVAPPSCD
jgi:hypothetical protein